MRKGRAGKLQGMLEGTHHRSHSKTVTFMLVLYPIKLSATRPLPLPGICLTATSCSCSKQSQSSSPSSAAPPCSLWKAPLLTSGSFATAVLSDQPAVGAAITPANRAQGEVIQLKSGPHKRPAQGRRCRVVKKARCDSQDGELTARCGPNANTITSSLAVR